MPRRLSRVHLGTLLSAARQLLPVSAATVLSAPESVIAHSVTEATAKNSTGIDESLQGRDVDLRMETRGMADADTRAHLSDTVVNEEFMKYFRENSRLRVNSEGERTEGTVTVEFRVNDRGVPSAIRVISGFSQEANHEIIDLLVNGPLWTPTKGRRVRMVIDY